MFNQLYFSVIISELASENISDYIYPVPIHEYIQNIFLTCTREVGDPVLSQNVDLEHAVLKTKQEIKMQTKTLRSFKDYSFTFFGLMCKKKSHMAHEYAGHRSRVRTKFLN